MPGPDLQLLQIVVFTFQTCWWICI